jgi:hypothetical protein
MVCHVDNHHIGSKHQCSKLYQNHIQGHEDRAGTNRISSYNNDSQGPGFCKFDRTIQDLCAKSLSQEKHLEL